MTKRLFWFFISIFTFNSAYGASKNFAVTKIEVPSKFSVVFFQGPLLEGSGQEVVDALDEAPQDTILLELNSIGGRMKESEKIQNAVERLQQQGKTVHTFVANGSTCQSACTLIFMMGKKRIAGETASFMFHAVQYESPRGVTDSFQTNTVLRYYISKGISAEWLAKLKTQGVFTSVNDYFISAKDAEQQQIGLITELWSPLVIHTPAPFDPQIRPR